jgi:hypothetical protein
MREILYKFEEFKQKVDTAKPIHHAAKRKTKDGFFYKLIFRVYGIDKNNGHIIIFEVQANSTLADFERHPSEYRKFVEKYAKPLGSTEGAWLQ